MNNAGTIGGPTQQTPPCEIPSQPKNGRWRLHKSQCQNGRHCDVSSTTSQLRLGAYLIYTCDDGYKLINGTIDVFCTPEGRWSQEPWCEGKLESSSFYSWNKFLKFLRIAMSRDSVPLEFLALPIDSCSMTRRRSVRRSIFILALKNWSHGYDKNRDVNVLFFFRKNSFNNFLFLHRNSLQISNHGCNEG